MRKDIGLYRGKQKDNGEWVYGNLLKLNKRTFIVPQNTWFKYGELMANIEVIPDTVGEYTGVTDTIGRKIFEGDIIKCTRLYDIGCYPTFKTEIHEVVYAEGCFTPLYDCERNSFEVIGNRFDNPELLKTRQIVKNSQKITKNFVYFAN